MSETYYRTIDPYPLESQAFNKLYPFYQNLREGKFTSTWCKRCSRTFWPPRPLCPQCTSDELEWVELPRRGRIHAFSIQEMGVPPGFTAPLVLAVIDLNGLKVFSRIVESDVQQVAIGKSVTFCTITLPSPDCDPDRVLPAFKLG